MGDHRPWEVGDIDRDLPPALAAQVRAQLGAGEEATAPPPGPPPKQRERPKPVPLISQDRAKAIAEAAALRSYRHARPLGGHVWGCRAESCQVRKAAGMLGSPAFWRYDVGGYVHAGWVVSGRVVRWAAQVRAEDGAVLGVQFKGKGW